MIYRANEHVDELRENMRGGEGTVKLTALSGELPQHMRLFSTITLEPGSSIGEHVHENETELFYFLSGSGKVLDDGAPFAIAPGDTMITPSGHSHSVINDGTETLVLVAAIIKD